MPAIGSYNECDLNKVNIQTFLTYSRYAKRAYFERMERQYGFTPEAFAKEMGTNVGSVKVWMSRVGHDPGYSITARQKRNYNRLKDERMLAVIGPSMPARKLLCVYE